MFSECKINLYFNYCKCPEYKFKGYWLKGQCEYLLKTMIKF